MDYKSLAKIYKNLTVCSKISYTSYFFSLERIHDLSGKSERRNSPEALCSADFF